MTQSMKVTTVAIRSHCMISMHKNIGGGGYVYSQFTVLCNCNYYINSESLFINCLPKVCYRSYKHFNIKEHNSDTVQNIWFTPTAMIVTVTCCLPCM